MNTEETDAEVGLKDLQSKVKSVLQILLEMNLMVCDFQPNSNPVFHKKMQTFVGMLKDLDDMKNHFDQVMVPHSVINLIDQCQNPDLFTQEFIERAAAENQFTNGKIDAFKKFKKELYHQLQTSFPTEFQDYLTQKGISDVEQELSKRHPKVTLLEQSKKLSIRLKPSMEYDKKRRMSEDDVEIDVVS